MRRLAHACSIVALGAGALLVSAAWALARYGERPLDRRPTGR